MSSGESKTIILCMIFQVAQLTSACDFATADLGTVNLNETQGPEAGVLKTITLRDSNLTMDAHMFELSVRANESHTYRSFNEYFNISKTRLQNGMDAFKVTLAKVINMDLNRTVKRGSKGEVKITVLYTCMTRTKPYPVFAYHDVIVCPVDNHPLKLISNLYFFVPEDVPVEYSFNNLRNAVIDQDYPDYTTLVEFRIYRNPPIENNGGTVFRVSQTGNVSAITPLDYDLGLRYYKLYIAVTNNRRQMADGIITIQVLNVNDNPVQFQGCPPVNCTWVLDTTDQRRGLLAVDADGEMIEYSITNVIPRTEQGVMVINNNTGRLMQMQHPNNHTLQCLTLTVKAKTRSNLPIARNKNAQNLTEAYYVVVIHFLEVSFYSSSTNRVLNNGFLLPGCLTMIYGIFML